MTNDLWFTKEDRQKNLDRVTFVASLLEKHWVWILASFVSPYIENREKIRSQIPNFIEVFVNAPLEICEERDVKWLYQKARQWVIENFTWISDPYEDPQNPEITIHTDKYSIQECVQQVYDYIKNNNYL